MVPRGVGGRGVESDVRRRSALLWLAALGTFPALLGVLAAAVWAAGKVGAI